MQVSSYYCLPTYGEKEGVPAERRYFALDVALEGKQWMSYRVWLTVWEGLCVCHHVSLENPHIRAWWQKERIHKWKNECNSCLEIYIYMSAFMFFNEFQCLT